jgi:hypothetical protein
MRLTHEHRRQAIYPYPNVNHAFNDDTGSRYDKGTAEPGIRPHNRIAEGKS